MLDEDPDPVRPCALDDLREVEGLVGLVHDHLAAGLGVGGVRRIAAAGVEAHAGDGRDMASVDAEPRVAERVDLWNVGRHVVVEFVATSGAAILRHSTDDPITRRSVTRNHTIRLGMDDREMDGFLLGDQLTHECDRRQ